MEYLSGPEVELTLKEFAALPRAECGMDLLHQYVSVGTRHIIMALGFIPLVAERISDNAVMFHLVKWPNQVAFQFMQTVEADLASKPDFDAAAKR